MKIAVVIENYVAGGSDFVVREIANLDYANQYCFFVNKSNDIKNLQPLPKNTNLQYYNNPTIPDIAKFLESWQFGSFIKKIIKIVFYPVFLIFVLLEATIKILMWKPEIIIYNNGGYPGGYVTRFLPFLTKTFVSKNIMFVHNFPTPPKLKFASRIIDKFLNKYVKFVSVAKNVSIALKNLRKIDSIVLANSFFKKIEKINHKEIKHKKDFIQIWCIGSINPRKNQIDLIDKLSLVEKNMSSTIKLNLIGLMDDKDEYTLKLLSSVSKLKKINVKFHGFVRNFKYKNYPFQFLVINSTIEGLPIVMLEALAAGIPVVSTPVGGIPEVIEHGNNGFMYNDDYQFENIMRNIDLLSLDDWLKMSNKAYLTSIDFCPQQYLKKYREIIK